MAATNSLGAIVGEMWVIANFFQQSRSVDDGIYWRGRVVLSCEDESGIERIDGETEYCSSYLGSGAQSARESSHNSRLPVPKDSEYD